MKTLYLNFALLCALCSLLAPQLGAMEGRESSGKSESQAAQEAVGRGYSGIVTVDVPVNTVFIAFNDRYENQEKYRVTVPYTERNEGQSILLSNLGRELRERIEQQQFQVYPTIEWLNSDSTPVTGTSVLASSLENGDVFARITVHNSPRLRTKS